MGSEPFLMDFKGIALYLGLSFLLIFVLTFVLLAEGALAFQSPNAFQYLAQVLLMGIPALAALAAGFMVPSAETSPPAKLWPVSRVAALRVLLMPLAVFALSYTVATLLGLTYPQWNLAGLLNEVEAVSTEPLAPNVRALAPGIIFVTYPLVSIGLGATLFALIALGSEFGWRGYLLPRLMPLGALPAHLLVGLCWGLWFFPLLYSWHRELGDYSGLWETQLRAIVLCMVLSLVLGTIKHRTEHLGLCALALGGIAGQACGIWEHLFQQQTPPWTGNLGWILIGVLLASAALPGLWSQRAPESD